MADNSRITPLVNSLNAFGKQKVLDAIQLLGKNLPCKITKIEGQIVTVAFELQSGFTLPPVSMPIATSKYDWIPYQVGDKGIAATIDTYQGGISGLGGGSASLGLRSNLSMLRFQPIAEKSWTTPNGNVRIIQGPDGVTLQDTSSNTKFELDKTGHIKITGDLRVTGSITAGFDTGDSVTLQNHTHDQGPDSDGDTEMTTHPPNAGT